MANKDGIVSIGFDYKKELDEVCATIEKELNNLGGDINLSDGIKKQMAEVKKMIADMKKDIGSSFDKITETKLDTKTFESFKKDVNKRIREINKEVTTLKEQFSTLDGSANVNNIVQQFANLKKHVEDSNASISEFINNSEKLGKSVIISPNLNTDTLKNDVVEIRKLLTDLNKEDLDFGYTNKSTKELTNDLEGLVDKYYRITDLIDEMKTSMNGMDTTTQEYKNQQVQLSKLSLELVKCSAQMDDLFGAKNAEKINVDKIISVDELDDIFAHIKDISSKIKLEAKNIVESIELSNTAVKNVSNNATSDLSNKSNIEVHISTKQSTINKQLDEMIDNLQQRAANKPIIAPVKLRVDSEYEKTTKDASASALTENQINEARKDIENVVPGLEKAFNNSMRIATNKAVENAKESIKAVREFFETNPITVHLTIPEDERLKIGKSILSEDGKTTVDISGQVDKARKSVKGLSEDLEKSQLLIKENAQNAKNLSLEKLVNSLSETMTQFSELKGIVSSIQNMENTIARASGISSTNELVEQWSVVEKTIVNATKLDGDFRKNANIGKIVSEYQKYIDMGGANALSSIDKIKDNETTINSILSKMKELKSQDIENDSIQKLSVDLDGVIAKFDELISTVKTTTNALYKIIKQGSVSNLDKQWSSISNKFKTIADESGKINLSKQKTDIKELMDMYQKYANAGGTNSLMSLTDNVETLRKLDKECQKLNQTQSVDNSSTIEKESESFKSVEKSVDSLTTAIGDTKVQAINVEATAMEDAAEREIMAIKSILDNLDLVVNRLKDIKGIKLPKIEVKNVDVVEKAVESLENAGNKSNISSENSSLSQLNKEQKELDEIAIKLQEIKEIENKIASKKELGEDFRMLKLDLDLAKQKLKDLTAVKLQEELKDILGTTDIWYRRVKSMSELLADTGGYFSNSLLSASSYFDVSDYRQQMIAGQIDTSKFFKLDAQGNQWNSLEKVFAESELGQKFKELGISVDEFIEKYHIRVDLGAKYTTEFVANVAKELGYLGIIFENINDNSIFNANGTILPATTTSVQVFDSSALSNVKNITNLLLGTSNIIEDINNEELAKTQKVGGDLISQITKVQQKLIELRKTTDGKGTSTSKLENIKQILLEIQSVDFKNLDKISQEQLTNKLESEISKLKKSSGVRKFSEIYSSIINDIENELSKIREQIENPIEDVFQGGTTSAEKLEEEIKNIDSATEKASESAKEYRKILSQVGEFDIDSKVSAMYKRNDGQLESWTWRAKKDDEGNVLYDKNGKIDYDEPTVTVISKYEQLEKIIVKADNELRNLQKDLAEIKAYDPTASTTNIEAKISDQKEYIRLLEQTVKVISQSDEYLLDEQQIIEARNKAAREYALTTGAKQEKTDAKQSASDEKKRLANIEQVNRALNKQQITIDAIEKTYNKTTNPDLDREVSNQQDLAELAQKKLAIQTKINSLQGKERNSANEKEFLELEKLIAEYKELAKYKLKSNNPSKQELGGQNLQTLIQVQISNYDKLITKAKKYGDSASDTVEKLKEQRDILSKMGSDGKYSATADQYYASRDTYKVESAALSAFEAETKAAEQETKAVQKLAEEKRKLRQQEKQSTQSSVDKALKDQVSAWKQIQSIREKIAKSNDANEIENLKKVKKEYQQSYIEADKILKTNSDLYDKEAQIAKLEQVRLETNKKIADYKNPDISSMESSLARFEESSEKLSLKPDNEHSFESWKLKIDELNNAINEYRNKITELQNKDGIIDKEDISEVTELENRIKSLLREMQKTSSGDKGFEDISATKIAEQIHKLLEDNTAMSRKAKAEIQAYYDEVASGNPSRPLKEIYNDALKVVQAERAMGREGKSFLDTMKDKAWYGWAAQITSMFGVYDIINIFKQGANTLKEFDDGLTKISYTMDMTKSQFDGLGKSVLDMSNNLDSSISNAMQVAQIYANMNTSAEEIQKLSEPTLILSNLTGFDASTVADDIQAVTQQFNIAAEDSMHIADVYDQISRNISVDYSKGIESIAEAVQVAGSTADQAGLSFEQLASIVGKTVEKTRLEGSQVGNGLKTIMTRLSKVGELSEEVDNETLSQASESLKKVGIEVYNLDGSYREFDVIMGELAGKWGDLTDAEKSNISFNIAA